MYIFREKSGADDTEHFFVFHIYPDEVTLKVVAAVSEVLGMFLRMYYIVSWCPIFNLIMVFWGLFRPRRVLIVPNFVIGCILLLLILIILCITEGIRTDI